MKNKNYKTMLIILILVCFAFVLFYITDNSSNGKKISINPGVYELIEQDKVAAIYVSSGTGKIMLKDSENVTAQNFPSKSDFYFTYTAVEQAALYNAVESYNATKTESADKIIYVSEVAQSSFIEKAIPYLSIIMLLVFGFFLIRTIVGANSKNFNFGKTKAKIAQNVKVNFSDVAGIDEEKEEVQEIVEFLKNPQKFTEIGAKIPKGVLIIGPPGTGKTLLAKAIAGESNVPFFSISGSDFVEMFVGVGASRVRDLFEQAKKSSPCIVFIDEIDAVGRQRGAGLGGGNDEREQTLNQLLVQMDGFEPNEGIIVIAATNRSDVLDPALLRPGRFDRQIFVHPPDVKGREKIIEVHARNKPIDSSVNFKTLARLTSGFTGADIENLLNEAAIYTAKQNRKKITMTDITEGINKVLMGPQKKSRVITEKDKRITACHESGHAILGLVLPSGDVVQEVSIIPRGDAAGYTISRPEGDDMHMSFNKLNDTIAMLLAGRAAEKILIKDISTGAQNDIQRASKIARKMVTEWGMSNDLGVVDFGSSQEIFVGRDYQTQKTYSEQTAAKIDAEVKKIMDYNYQRALDIINKNLKKLNVMIDVLLERETIYFEEVKMIMEGKGKAAIIKEMDSAAEIKKSQAEKERAEADLEKAKKDQGVRLKTAEALRSAGVISQEEFEKVKSEAAKIVEDAQKKMEEVLANYNDIKPEKKQETNLLIEKQPLLKPTKQLVKTDNDKALPKTDTSKSSAESKTTKKALPAKDVTKKSSSKTIDSKTEQKKPAAKSNTKLSSDKKETSAKKQKDNSDKK